MAIYGRVGERRWMMDDGRGKENIEYRTRNGELRSWGLQIASPFPSSLHYAVINWRRLNIFVFRRSYCASCDNPLRCRGLNEAEARQSRAFFYTETNCGGGYVLRRSLKKLLQFFGVAVRFGVKRGCGK